MSEPEAIAQRVVELLGMDRRPFYTVFSLADRLAVSERTVREMVKRGVIASYKVEGARRFDPAEVDRYLAAHKEAA